MESPETSTHSFVIRLWQEETATEMSAATWRGHITHIPGNERVYIKNLDEIKQFIAPYLRGMKSEVSAQ
jgi:hypothetical protein